MGSARGQPGVSQGSARGQPGVSQGSARGQPGVSQGSARGQPGVSQGSNRGHWYIFIRPKSLMNIFFINNLSNVISQLELLLDLAGLAINNDPNKPLLFAQNLAN